MNYFNLLNPTFLEHFNKTIQEGVILVEKQKELSGEEKKAKCIEFIQDAYKTVDVVFEIPAFIDDLILNLVPILIDESVRLFNEYGWEF